MYVMSDKTIMKPRPGARKADPVGTNASRDDVSHQSDKTQMAIPKAPTSFQSGQLYLSVSDNVLIDEAGLLFL